MADHLLTSLTVGLNAAITLDFYRAETPSMTGSGPARKAYVVATKGGQIVLDTRQNIAGGAAVEPWPKACRPAGYGHYTHIVGDKVPLTPAEAPAALAAWTAAAREYDEACAAAGRAYHAGRRAAVLREAGGAAGAADIEATSPGGYAAYERAELRAQGRRDPEFPAGA